MAKRKRPITRNERAMARKAFRKFELRFIGPQREFRLMRRRWRDEKHKARTVRMVDAAELGVTVTVSYPGSDEVEVERQVPPGTRVHFLTGHGAGSGLSG